MAKLNISEKIRGIVSNLADEIKECNKEYLLEKITLAEKNERVKSVVSIAHLRINQEIENLTSAVLKSIKIERVNSTSYERIKDTILENL